MFNHTKSGNFKIENAQPIIWRTINLDIHDLALLYVNFFKDFNLELMLYSQPKQMVPNSVLLNLGTPYYICFYIIFEFHYKNLLKIATILSI